MNDPSSSRTKFINDSSCLVLLSFMTLLTFWPVMGNGFVNWDDPSYITRNPLFQLPLLSLWKEAVTSFPLGNYHPLTTLGQAVEHTLFGSTPLAYHLISLLTHIFNVLLIYLLLRRVGMSILASGAATLLFALHPQRVEAVAWVSAQKDLWCTSFVLTSLHAYLSYIRSNNHQRKRLYVLSLTAFFLALCAKGTAMVLPLFLCLVDLVIERKWSDRSLWIEKIPFFAFSFLFGIIALIARHNFQAVLEEAPVSANLIGLAAYRLVTFGLHTLIPLPHHFPIYPPETVGVMSLQWYSLPALLLLFVVCFFLWRRCWRIEVLGIFFFVLGVAPALPLQNLGYAGDRFTYLAAIGLALASASFFDRLRQRLSVRSGQLFAAIVVAGVVVLLLTSQRLSAVWYDSDRLISEYIELYQANPGREKYLALAYETRGEGRRQAGQNVSAQADFAAARQAWPEWAEGLILGGEELTGQGQLSAALEIFDRAARLDPGNARIFAGRAIVNRRMGRLHAALNDADQAVRLLPGDVVAYNSRGTVLQALNRPAEALADFSRAVELAPDAEVPHINRGLVYVDLGKREFALAEMEAVLRINPQNGLAQEWVARLKGGR